jgi:hypothetical protein
LPSKKSDFEEKKEGGAVPTKNLTKKKVLK